MSAKASIMMWAQRIAAKRGSAPHELLEINPNATLEVAQLAFHKIARIAHPDLHRATLSAEELELLNAAYAIVAGAYQSYRTPQTGGTQPLPREPAHVRATRSGPAPGATAAQTMSQRALLYYRKAELALKRGDLKAAVLQIKLAIAADPQSAFLRAALTEVEAELAK
jgi:hypothetical protein